MVTKQGGGTWSRASVQPCTDEARKIFMEKYYKLNLIRELEKVSFRELPLDKLEKIKAVLD